MRTYRLIVVILRIIASISYFPCIMGMVIIMDFQRRLRGLLEERGMSQQEFARQIHVAESTLSQYLTGRRKPAIEIITQIADFFEVSIDYLVGRTSLRNYSIWKTQQKWGKSLAKAMEEASPEYRERVPDYFPVIEGALNNKINPDVLQILLNAYIDARELDIAHFGVANPGKCMDEEYTDDEYADD